MNVKAELHPDKLACWNCGNTGEQSGLSAYMRCDTCQVGWYAGTGNIVKASDKFRPPRYIDHGAEHRPAPA